MNVSVSLYI